MYSLDFASIFVSERRGGEDIGFVHGDAEAAFEGHRFGEDADRQAVFRNWPKAYDARTDGPFI